MVKRSLTRDERRVRDYLITGHSRQAAARHFKLAPQTVRDISDRLEYYGEIRRIPGTSKPVSYEAVRDVVVSPPLGGEGDQETPTNGLGVEYEHHSVPLTEYPRGVADAHLHGLVKAKVENVGSFEIIRDRSGVVVGQWSDKIATPRGRRDRFLTLYGFGQKIKVTYSEGNEGCKTLQMYPGRVVATDETAKDRIMGRADWIAEMMRINGWRVSGLEIRGKVAYAYNDTGLLRHLDKGKQHPDAEVWGDTSKDDPEVETTGSDNAHVIEFLPTHIRNIWETEREQAGQIAALNKEIMNCRLETAKINRDIALEALNAAERDRDMLEIVNHNFSSQSAKAVIDKKSIIDEVMFR